MEEMIKEENNPEVYWRERFYYASIQNVKEDIKSLREEIKEVRNDIKEFRKEAQNGRLNPNDLEMKLRTHIYELEQTLKKDNEAMQEELQNAVNGLFWKTVMGVAAVLCVFVGAYWGFVNYLAR